MRPSVFAGVTLALLITFYSELIEVAFSPINLSLILKEETGGEALSAVLLAGKMLWGDSPLGYHLFGMALHCAAVMGLAAFCMSNGMSRTATWIAAILFTTNVAHFRALHALHGFPHIMALALSLAALNVLVRYARSGDIRLQAAAIALFAGAVLSDAASLVLLPLCYLACIRAGMSMRKAFHSTISVGIVGAVLCFVAAAFDSSPPGTSLLSPEIDTRWMITSYLSFWSRLVTTAHWILVIPHDFNPWELPIGYVAIASCFALSLRYPRPTGLWSIWALLTTLPYTMLSAEHLGMDPAGPGKQLYLASAGTSALLGCGLAQLGEKIDRIIAGTGKFLLPLILSAMLMSSFWAHQRAHSITMFDLGKKLVLGGHPKTGLPLLEKAVNAGGYDVPVYSGYSLMIQTALTFDANADSLIAVARTRFPDVEMFLAYELVAHSMSTDTTVSRKARNRLQQFRGHIDATTSSSISTAYYNLGVGLRKIDKFDLSVHALAQALTFKPGHRRSQVLLGATLMTNGQSARAIDILSRLPDDRVSPWTHMHLGHHHRQLGNLKPALLHLLEAERRAPRDASIQYDLALTYQDGLRDHERAIPHWRRAIEFNMPGPDAYLHLGNAYSYLGNQQEARTWFERALETYPAIPQAAEITRFLHAQKAMKKSNTGKVHKDGNE